MVMTIIIIYHLGFGCAQSHNEGCSVLCSPTTDLDDLLTYNCSESMSHVKQNIKFNLKFKRMKYVSPNRASLDIFLCHTATLALALRCQVLKLKNRFIISIISSHFAKQFRNISCIIIIRMFLLKNSDISSYYFRCFVFFAWNVIVFVWV